MLAYLRARAMSSGFLGGSRMWIGIGFVVWTIKFFQWLTRPETEVIYREPLGAGAVGDDPPRPRAADAVASARRRPSGSGRAHALEEDARSPSGRRSATRSSPRRRRSGPEAGQAGRPRGPEGRRAGRRA